MKSTLIFLFALLTLSVSANPGPTGSPTEQSFERFVALFHDNLALESSDFTASFFSTDFRYVNARGDTLDAEGFLKFLDHFGNSSDLLEAMARGFVFTGNEEEAVFVSLHNRLREGVLIEVKPDALRLRKLPSTTSPTICILQRGFYSGSMGDESERFCDALSGLEWQSFSLLHDELGMVTGYLAVDYIEVNDTEMPRSLVARYTAEGWKFTSVL